MGDVAQFTDKLRTTGGQFWKDLGTGRRVAVITVVTIGIALLGLFVLWARTPSYAAVYSNLSEEQAGAVVAKLKEMKVPYQVREGGTVLVPSDQVQDVRIQLATAGVPQGGGVGFELFDQTSFGLTDFAQKINYQRALEGELSRTINRLDAVEQSRVHIVIPQQSLYADNQKEARASVVLHLRPGRRLNQSQLRGITQLVSGSVEGLKPENVTVVDGQGNVLADQTSNSGSDQSSSASKVDAQNAYESRLAESLQSMLNRIVGPGKATVQVSATLDWDKVESNSEIYSPDGLKGQVRSQHEVVESFGSGGRSGAAGIPGVDSNVPTYQAVKPTTTAVVTDSGAQRKESTINYELSRRTERVVKAPGGVKRLSIAVVADSAVVSSDQVETLRQVVSAAAGLNPERGDVITVTSLPFERTDYQTSIEAAQSQEFIISVSRIAAIVLGPLLLLGFLWLILRPRHAAQAKELAVATAPVSLPAAAGIALPSADGRMLLPQSEQDSAREQVRQRVYSLAKDNPAMLAQLIQTWMEEERS